MIIVRLSGGLGNQLFQYALGRSLSLHKNTALYFDTSFYDRSPNRSMDLGHFHVKGKFLSRRQVYGKMGWTFDYWKEKLFGGDRLLQDTSVTYREKAFQFSEDVFRDNTSTLIDGYWQSEKYFSMIRKELLAELSLVGEIPSAAKDLLTEIRQCESVSLHLRRGDYVSNPMIAAIHGMCSDAYYEKAIDAIREKLPEAKFYIFSDDAKTADQWAAKLNGATAVHHSTGMDTFTEFELMKCCKHQILANSSFSWWAAWLNVNPMKQVIAPAKWFADATKNTADLYPESWIKINA